MSAIDQQLPMYCIIKSDILCIHQMAGWCYCAEEITAATRSYSLHPMLAAAIARVSGHLSKHKLF